MWVKKLIACLQVLAWCCICYAPHSLSYKVNLQQKLRYHQHYTYSQKLHHQHGKGSFYHGYSIAKDTTLSVHKTDSMVQDDLDLSSTTTSSSIPATKPKWIKVPTTNTQPQPVASNTNPIIENSYVNRHPQVIKMFNRAKFLIKNGDNLVAKKLLLRCIELHKYDSYSWLFLARLEAKTGHIEQARSTFEQASQLFPTNVHILQAWGVFEQKYGRLDVAKDCLQRALEIDPSNAYVTFALSSFQQRVGNANEAKNILTKLVNTKPTSAVCVSLSEMERKAGNIAKAKQILLDGLERCDEEVSKLYLSLAWLEEDSFHNFDKAVEYLDKALEIEPYNTRVFIARASLAVRNNKVDEARKILQQAAETIPISKGDGQIYTMWSTIELECGNLAKAREVIMRGYQLYPGDHFLLQRWASFESKIGNVEKARELFEKSVLLKPHAPTFVAWAILEENEGVKFYRQSREAAQTTTSFSASTALQVIQNFELSGNNDHTLPVLKEVQEADNSLMNYKQDVEVSVQYSKEEGKVFAEDKFQQARELFMIGMEADPLHGPLYHAYGNMESRRGNTTGARQIFQKGISRKASDYVALYHAWGLLEMKAGNLTLASELFQKGIEDALDHGHLRDIQPKISYLFHSLGMLYLDQRRFQDAYETFQSALVIFPKYSPILLGFAIVNMKMGQFTAAKEYFKRAVDADQFHPHAWQAWAVAEKQLGNIELSRILFREGLKYGASHAALWHGYAVMEMQQGNFDIARYLFAQAIHRSVTSSPTSSSSSIDHLISAALPFNPHAQSYQAWACLELRLGNVQRSKQLVEEGMKVARDHAALWTVAGLVEMKLGNQDFALRILEQGIKRFPKHGALYKVLGELHVKIGNVVEARQIFSLGLEHDPFYAPTYHSAALLEAKIGNLENLAELHRKAKLMFNQPTGLPFQTYSAIPLEGIDQDLVESRGGDVENLHDSRKRSNANIFERIQQLHQAAQQVLDCQDADEDHALNHRKSGVNELTNVVQTQMSDSLINDKVFMDDLEQR